MRHFKTHQIVGLDPFCLVVTFSLRCFHVFRVSPTQNHFLTAHGYLQTWVKKHCNLKSEVSSWRYLRINTSTKQKGSRASVWRLHKCRIIKTDLATQDAVTFIPYPPDPPKGSKSCFGWGRPPKVGKTACVIHLSDQASQGLSFGGSRTVPLSKLTSQSRKQCFSTFSSTFFFLSLSLSLSLTPLSFSLLYFSPDASILSRYFLSLPLLPFSPAPFSPCFFFASIRRAQLSLFPWGGVGIL